MYIYLTDKIKITNPLLKSDIHSYEGPIENINFKNQKNNFRKLSNKLNRIGVFFNYIWYGEFSINNSVVYHFVAKTNDNRIYWRKYEGNSIGSGQNFIYIDGIKFKTTDFLRWSDEELDNKLTNSV